MIGLVPCAGRAERLHGLPKYLLPLPDGFLLERICDDMWAITDETFIGAGQHNNDLLGQYVNFQSSTISYLHRETVSMVDTLLEMKPDAEAMEGKHNYLMAMPDTYWSPEPDLFPQMAQLLDVSDVVLAVWRIRDSQRGKLGMVDLDGTDVRGIDDKDLCSPLEFAWGAMAWRPVFWNYMKPEHSHLGLAVNAAIANGLHVRAVIASGDYYDCGSFEGYAELVRALTEEKIHGG